MNYPLTIALALPSPQLSPNRRGQWWRHSGAIAEARRSARLVALAVVSAGETPGWPSGRIVCNFHWDYRGASRRRYPDMSNAIASLKPYIDGLVDAGVYTDDRDVRCEMGTWVIDQESPRIEMVCHGPETKGARHEQETNPEEAHPLR